MITLQELAAHLGGVAVGNLHLKISGVSEIQRGKKGTITFLSNAKYRGFLHTTKASAVLVNDVSVLEDKSGIVVENPQLAIARTLKLFNIEPSHLTGIHSTAVIHKTASIGKDVTIGAHAVVEAGVSIGDNSIIGAQCFIGEKSVLGTSSVLFPNVSIYHNSILGNRVRIHSGTVIGCDGYGFVTDKDIHHKIPQTGTVTIEEDVEIGANCAIDRATIGTTTIGACTKLDNLVHIAHNVLIGKGCLITAQVAIAGSAEIGNFCTFAGQSGVAPHVKIGDRAVFAAKSGVTKSLPGGKIYAGMPAREIREQNRRDAVHTDVTKLKKRLKKLEDKLA